MVASSQVLEAITEDAVAELALQLGSIDSPAGHESAVAEFVYHWMEREGFSPKEVALLPDRPNIVGRLAGSGSGHTIAFNSHMDTSVAAEETWSTEHAADAIYHTAWRDGTSLVGNGLCNDKGPMAAWLIACRALRDHAGSLPGDVVLTAVCGEIEIESVDEYQPPQYASRELGTRFVIGKGAVADCAVVAEATDFALAYVEAGSLFVKVTVRGLEPPVYSPFVTGPSIWDGNAIVKLASLIEGLGNWAGDYEPAHREERPGGVVSPRINIGAIRGGLPYKITKTAQQAAVYVDVRLTPSQAPMQVLRELRSVVGSLGLDATVDVFGYRRGFESPDVTEVAAAVRFAHAELFGGEPKRPGPAITSMWRDLNAFAEAGIPCVMYGPGPSIGAGNFAIASADLVSAARAYALIALRVAGHE